MLYPLSGELVDLSLKTFHINNSNNINEKMKQTYEIYNEAISNNINLKLYSATGNFLSEMNKGILFNIEV